MVLIQVMTEPHTVQELHKRCWLAERRPDFSPSEGTIFKSHLLVCIPSVLEHLHGEWKHFWALCYYMNPMKRVPSLCLCVCGESVWDGKSSFCSTQSPESLFRLTSVSPSRSLQGNIESFASPHHLLPCITAAIFPVWLTGLSRSHLTLSSGLCMRMSSFGNFISTEMTNL